MRARTTIVGILVLLCGFACLWPHWASEGKTSPIAGLGGKAEHCAMAIGVIGASILSLFANPLSGPAAVGAMSLGLIWMVATCE